MSEPFLAEVRLLGFNFAPRGWALCDGQILPISQNQSLYSLLGTTYGGDGRTSFGLPDLRGRTPIHVGNGHTLGQQGGEQTVTLSEQQLPAHNHVLSGSTASVTLTDPSGASVGVNTSTPYRADADGAMGTEQLARVGGGQGHENMQPFQTLNFAIALVGLFPSRN